MRAASGARRLNPLLVLVWLAVQVVIKRPSGFKLQSWLRSKMAALRDETERRLLA
eukprot:SAG25_NODE_618_length_6422_cov_3.817894_11_plen_55_part_00